MTGWAPGMLAAVAVLRFAAAGSGSFVTAPQHDPLPGPIAQRSADVSADGRYVAFESYVQLVPADTNDRRDIYVLDLATRRVTLESTSQDAQASAGHPRLSADGHFLVYQSESIAAQEPLYRSSIVLCDRWAATSRVISAGADGAPANGGSRDPDISDDGRVVAFVSSATNLLAGPDGNGSQEDIYTLDVTSGALQRASVDSRGMQPPSGASVSPSLSGDGRSVAFASSAQLDQPPLGRGNTASRRTVRQVYIRDIAAGVTSRVSSDTGSALPDGDSWAPAVNRDGRFVAFVSDATNLPGSTVRNKTTSVFLRDRRTGGLTLVSRAAAAERASGTSGSPSISADGRLVAFQSDASDLVCSRRCPPADDDINLLPDVFMFDRAASTMRRVSQDGSGGWMEASRGPALDATGQVVAFASQHPTDPLDRGNDLDLFVTTDDESQALDIGGLAPGARPEPHACASCVRRADQDLADPQPR